MARKRTSEDWRLRCMLHRNSFAPVQIIRQHNSYIYYQGEENVEEIALQTFGYCDVG